MTQVLQPNWSLLVEGVRKGQQDSLEQLYLVLRGGYRHYMVTQIYGYESNRWVFDIDDRVHHIWIEAVKSVQHGDVREPERFAGYLRTLVQRNVLRHIEEVIQNRKNVYIDAQPDAQVFSRTNCANPEESVIRLEQKQLMRYSLRHLLNEKDRIILTKFYLLEEPYKKICKEMKLTDTQFRLLKSRALRRLAEKSASERKVKLQAAAISRARATAC